jgi:hypothetical protein
MILTVQDKTKSAATIFTSSPAVSDDLTGGHWFGLL